MNQAMKEFIQEWAEGKGHRTWVEDYVEDRGQWKLPDSKAINAALDSYPLDKAVFDKIADRQSQSLKYEGVPILRYLQTQGFEPVE